tara:strand:- start:94 stop:696 length:603 start_codon:yes stop_codon:yes gene_type:complete
MAFNINEFSSNINQYGVSKESFFDVDIVLPPGITVKPNDLDISRHLSLRCEAAEFPGLQVATADNKIYGPLQKIAYTGLYTDVGFSFIMSENMREKIFFEEWMESITGSQQPDLQNTFNIGYHNDYSTEITIRQFSPIESFGKVVYTCKLYDAFPITMSPVTLNRAGTEVHRLSIMLTYRRWESNNSWTDGILGGNIRRR